MSLDIFVDSSRRIRRTAFVNTKFRVLMFRILAHTRQNQHSLTAVNELAQVLLIHCHPFNSSGEFYVFYDSANGLLTSDDLAGPSMFQR